MTPTDKAALKLSIEVAKDPGRAEQIDHFLASRPWQQVAEFCASLCQGRSLDLKPWQIPPCDVMTDDLTRDHRCGAQSAFALLEKMELLGVSKFHPDPVAACEAAERKAAAP